MFPILDKKWTDVFRTPGVMDRIAQHIGMELRPKIFMHPMQMVLAMAFEQKREIVLDLYTEQKLPGFLTLRVTENAGTYSCSCKVEGPGLEVFHAVMVHNIEMEPALQLMLTGVRDIFRRKRLKLR